MRVLVTGASGFVGSAVIRALVRDGHEVLALVRNPDHIAQVECDEVDVALGDMWQPETYEPLVNDVDAVIHAAQQTTHGRWTKRKLAEMWDSDALMTRTLALACLCQNKRMIYSSGSLTHAYNSDTIVNESMPQRPCQLASGHAAMVDELKTLHRGDGLQVVILSPGFIYGAGGILQMTVEMMRRKQYRVIGSGTNYWSMVHVADVARAYSLALEHGIAGENYFLCDDLPLRRREVIDRVSDALRLPRVKHVPGWIVRLLMGFPLVEAITASQRLCNDKARQQLGWQPQFKTFADGLPSALAELERLQSGRRNRA